MKDLKLNLTIGEVNLLLESLGNMPYHKVFNIINKIHSTAEQQLLDTKQQKLDEVKND